MIADLMALNISVDDLPPPDYLARTWHEDMICMVLLESETYTIPRYQEQHQYPFRTGLQGKRFNGHFVGWLKETMRAFWLAESDEYSGWWIPWASSE